MAKKSSGAKKSAPVKKENNLAVIVLATVLISFPIGYVFGSEVSREDDSASSAAIEDTHDTADEKSHSHSETYEVPPNKPVPMVDLSISQDTKSGWNISVDFQNFTLTPENVNGAHVDNEGHAHLWVDGEKITRLYGPNYYLGDLSEGQHEISVTLNTNNHADYTLNGEVISDTVFVNDDHHAGEEGVEPHTH